ncbi:MAG: hypothetical protein EOM91_02690 [Sphingobacteriia bacterium]|nr:hypothetical protein [Sphingobacteriia bacterium]NCC38057.1 hypothetical protein [Gammaproteobacteria bacterium]
MRLLIEQVRAAIPFEAPLAQICLGGCEGCSYKLMSFLETELADWEGRLDHGERPTLADLARLARTARKVHAILERNGLVSSLDPPTRGMASTSARVD